MPASRAVRPSLPIPLLVATLAIGLVYAAPALGQRGGRGGGRPGGPSAGPGQRPAGPAAGGMQQPGRGGQTPGPGGPGHVGGAGPQSAGVGGPSNGRPGVGGPGAAGPGFGAPGAAGPVERRDVETFLGAKPAAAQAHATSVQATIAGRTQPFTPSWYAEHPNAWRYAHPYADWWAVAGAVGVYRWLAVPPPAATAGTTTTTGSTAVTQPAAEPPADLEWMPLGVFASAPRGSGQAHAYQQLAVSRSGELKGNYYDAVSDAVQPIAGTIDRDTRKAAWTVGKGARFDTTLDALLQPASEATMTAGSATQTWELTQMEKPAAGTK